MDGKTLRRSYDRAEGQSALHPVSAWAEERHLILGQLAHAYPLCSDREFAWIDRMERIRIDALRYSGSVSEPAQCRQGDGKGRFIYGYSVIFERRRFPSYKLYHPVHPVYPCKLFLLGKVGTREGQLAVDDKPNEITALPRLEETRYYLLSQAFPPQQFNHIVRGHWGIENRLHWYWT